MVIKYSYARLDLAAFGVPKDGTGSRRDVGARAEDPFDLR
jgi:hypothetical protein